MLLWQLPPFHSLIYDFRLYLLPRIDNLLGGCNVIGWVVFAGIDDGGDKTILKITAVTDNASHQIPEITSA